MKRLESSEIPVLPVQDIVAGETIAYGVGDLGVIIQFMDRDECILIDWFDIVSFGIELLKANSVEEGSADVEEIDAPTRLN